MKVLQLFRITLAELFALVTFVALSCVALLNASDFTAWVVGGVFWLLLMVAIAGAVTPGLLRRPFFLGFLGTALLHLYLVQYTAGRGHTSYDVDMPTFYLIEVLWNGIPSEHWGSIPRPSPIPAPGTGMRVSGLFAGNMGAAEFAHANFRGIGTQLFSILYGALTGFLAQSLARQVEQKRAASAH